MRKNQTITLACVVLMMSGLGRALPCFADVIHVPEDYPTIQEAVDEAAPTGDEIIVAPGTYNEAINLLGKAVYLHSSGGRDVTTIDATDLDASVITCISGETGNTIIEGFTITGGIGTYISSNRKGGGMYHDNSSPTVTDCTIENNDVSGCGGGMYNIESSPTLTNCMFENNYAGGFGGGELWSNVVDGQLHIRRRSS